MVLELDELEKVTLRQALESYEKELKDEIVKTDDRELKAVLHKEDDILAGLMKKISLQ